MESEPWYGVRCVFRSDGGLYEERITVWCADDFDHAIAQAEDEAREYAEIVEIEYLGLAQAYHLGDEHLGSGSEVFSLIRQSELPAEQYLDTFFDTGTERQTHWTPRET